MIIADIGFFILFVSFLITAICIAYAAKNILAGIDQSPEVRRIHNPMWDSFNVVILILVCALSVGGILFGSSMWVNGEKWQPILEKEIISE